MAGPTIASTSPSSGATSVPTNVTISVTFDQEVDLYRLKNGGIILEGPDENKIIGPSLMGAEPPETDEDKLLASPGFKGIKEVTYTTFRVDGSGDSIGYYDYGDTEDAGAIYRTKIELTPIEPLEGLTEYTVYVIGDEDTSDEYDYGLSSRTVYDTQKGANSGDGEVVFYGGYTGSVRQQFFVEITTGGVPGTAEYIWYTSADSVRRVGTTSPSYRPLKEGVQVRFPQGYTYAVGDTFSVWCDVPIFMDGSYRFSFTTSNFEPETLPIASTTLDGASGSVSSSTTSLSVSSTDPEDREALVPISTTQITVTFGGNIDVSTITDSTVTIQGAAADGSISGVPAYTTDITKTLSVALTQLIITLDEDQLYDNNTVLITLDSTVADLDGNSLGSDYEFFFATTHEPYYAGIRQVKLRLGSLGNSFTDDTIALAIWEGSREVLAFAPDPGSIDDINAYERARNQFVVCYAVYVLLSGNWNSLGGSVIKRLGDFYVSRSPSSSGNNPIDDLKGCIDYYQAIVEAGGVLGPKYRPELVVKGDNDLDSPHYGRLWEIPGTPIKNTKVIYSNTRRWYSTNLGRSSSGTKKNRWGR
jgi:hypothetical protein